MKKNNLKISYDDIPFTYSTTMIERFSTIKADLVFYIGNPPIEFYQEDKEGNCIYKHLGSPFDLTEEQCLKIFNCHEYSYIKGDAKITMDVLMLQINIDKENNWILLVKYK